MTDRVYAAQKPARNFMHNSENTYIRGVVLVFENVDRPTQFFRPQAVKAKTMTPDTNFNPLIIIGESHAFRTRECFAVIIGCAQKSALFKWQKTNHWCHRWCERSYFSQPCLGNHRTNPVFNVSLPLEVGTDDLPMEPIPIDWTLSTSAMFHFCLSHRPLSFLQAMPVFPTCSCFLCDRRSKRNESNCPCLQKSTLSAWVISARVISRDIVNEAGDLLTRDISKVRHWAIFLRRSYH